VGLDTVRGQTDFTITNAITSLGPEEREEATVGDAGSGADLENVEETIGGRHVRWVVLDQVHTRTVAGGREVTVTYTGAVLTRRN